MDQINNFIAGRWVEPESGQYLDNIDPSTGQVYSMVADSDERDVEKAVAAAENARTQWQGTPADQRSRILLRIADLIEDNLDRLARAECVDNGKPLKLARSLDIPRAAANFRFFGSSILHFHSEAHPMDDIAIGWASE